jgi:hypothetical protein
MIRRKFSILENIKLFAKYDQEVDQAAIDTCLRLWVKIWGSIAKISPPCSAELKAKANDITNRNISLTHLGKQ